MADDVPFTKKEDLEANPAHMIDLDPGEMSEELQRQLQVRAAPHDVAISHTQPPTVDLDPGEMSEELQRQL